MKHLTLIALCALLGTSISQAEPRSFTNTDGQTVKAELIGMEDENAVLQLGNGAIAKVAIRTLAEGDRSFVQTWWEENKDKLDRMDIRLSIDKNTERIDREVSKPKSSGGQKGQASPVVTKMTKDKVHFAGVLKSYVRKNVADITVDYTIYKRVSTRDKDGSKTTTEEIDGSASVKLLEAQGSATFETEAVDCEDFSQTGGTGPRLSKRETILGIVVTLSAAGKEFLKQSYPENFIERLEDEEKRQEDRG